MDIDHMRQLNTEFTAVAQLRNNVLGGITPITMLLVGPGTLTVPTPQFVNTIERNLDELAAGTSVAGLEPTKTWLGEDRDGRFLDYKDVNRWFESLRLLRVHFGG